MSLTYPAAITLKTLEIDGISVEICLSTEKETSENVLAKFIYELLENEHNQTLLNIQPDNAG